MGRNINLGLGQSQVEREREWGGVEGEGGDKRGEERRGERNIRGAEGSRDRVALVRCGR